MKTRFNRLGAVLVVSAAFLVAFQTGPPQDPTDLSAVLVWLASGVGAPFVVGMAFAMLAEYWPWFHTVKRGYKFGAGIVLSVAIAFGAQYVLAQPGLVEYVQPIFALVVSTVLAWLGQQYGLAKAERDGLNATAKRLAGQR